MRRQKAKGSVPIADPTDLPSSVVSRVGGGKIEVSDDDSNLKQRNTEECTGEMSEPSWSRAAMVEELNYFNAKHMWILDDLRRVKQAGYATHVRNRWGAMQQR